MQVAESGSLRTLQVGVMRCAGRSKLAHNSEANFVRPCELITGRESRSGWKEAHAHGALLYQSLFNFRHIHTFQDALLCFLA